ncbi:Histone-lysine N-methyltransferase, H3 lysine-9 specific SUVH6 [Cardamine amara subsp. amara]|uniref:Histone-lysine N-methyltransferase, H3 lysine-9 specific SUVH6 n=1 Tax=Cardamine amara subsp. amara TaxID=228776 RepID=A0ABD1B396_CARAN
MSFGMGMMDNSLVHTESSKLKSSLSNGSEEKRRGTLVLTNGASSFKIDLMNGIKFKRRKVFAVRDFPPGCGSAAVMPRLDVEAGENSNVVEEDDKVESSSALVKGVGEPNDVESSVPEPVVMEKTNDELIVFAPEVQENGNDVSMAEAVEVKPLRICLANDVVRDFPSETGSKGSESEKKVAEDSGSGGSDVSSSGRENMVRDIVVYADEGSLDLNQSEPVKVEKLHFRVPKSIHVAGRRKAKKGVAFHSALKRSKKIKPEYGESSRMRNSERDLYLRERENSDVDDYPDQGVARRNRVLNVMIPPSRPIGSSGNDSIRSKVKETLRLFYGACRKILQEQEALPKDKKKKGLRVDFEAAKILKSKGKCHNEGVQIMGPVPGVEVGDEFQYRMEMNVLGVHRPTQGGIDYMKVGEDILATSIVASGGYDDELDNSDILTYTGQGGNIVQAKKKGEELKEPEDQKLKQGNLALVNSVTKKNPVRVIRGKNHATLESSGRDAKNGGYIYDGLYLVEEFWQETGSHGKLVFKFKLRRMPGQPELSWKVVKKSKKLKYREGLCKLDISEGRERLPISAINEIDDEKPPQFTYTVKMTYPDWCRPVPPKACGCPTRCTEARNCSCVAKNGGEIPYNYDGAVVSAKTLIYECGPFCKCPASCYLRVTQRGIKFKLEIFKTESRGWGVRSLNSIPSGSFICEYIGELVEDAEAEKRTSNDEYLFDIGNKYDNSLAEGMSELMPGTKAGPSIEEESGFTIDAAIKGNVGRFINHSCSPNLYAQNVLYDHGDTRMPHVMFFAMDNIPPLQELSYHYNYMLDQVRDSKGNIKKKICYCGSSGCIGRLY